jgi:hypothetical protein
VTGSHTIIVDAEVRWDLFIFLSGSASQEMLALCRRVFDQVNAHIDPSMGGRLRDECLNVHQFVSLDDALEKIEARRIDYNHHRPHGSLAHLTPSEFVTQRQGVRTAEPDHDDDGGDRREQSCALRQGRHVGPT